MKTSSSPFLLTLLLIVALPAGSVLAQPYAPLAQLKTGAPPILRDEAVPSSDEVGIPAYPDAVILSVSSLQDGSGGKIPFLNLASEDPPEKVVAWYKERLTEMPGWSYDETYKVFYQGDDVLKALSMRSPYLNVMELAHDAMDMVYVRESVKKSLKSRIQIVYQPE